MRVPVSEANDLNYLLGTLLVTIAPAWAKHKVVFIYW